MHRGQGAARSQRSHNARLQKKGRETGSAEWPGECPLLGGCSGVTQHYTVPSSVGVAGKTVGAPCEGTAGAYGAGRTPWACRRAKQPPASSVFAAW